MGAVGVPEWVSIGLFIVGGVMTLIGTLLGLWIKGMVSSFRERIEAAAEPLERALADLEGDVRSVHDNASRAHARLDELVRETARAISDIKVDVGTNYVRHDRLREVIEDVVCVRLESLESQSKGQHELVVAIARRMHVPAVADT